MDYFILPTGFTPSLTNLVNGTLSANAPTGVSTWMSGALFGVMQQRDASGKVTSTDVSDQEFNYSHTDPSYFMMRLKTSGDVGGRKTLSSFADGAYIKMGNGAIFRKVGTSAYQIPGGPLDKKNFVKGSYTPIGKPTRVAYLQMTDAAHVVYEDLATFASGTMIPDSNGADYFCFWAGYWVASTLVSGRKATVMLDDGTISLVDNISVIDGKVQLPLNAKMVQFAKMGCCLVQDGNLIPYIPTAKATLPTGLQRATAGDAGEALFALQLGSSPVPDPTLVATGPLLNSNLSLRANQQTTFNGVKMFTDEFGMSATISSSPIKKVCGNASYAIGITNGLVDFLNVIPTPQSLGTPFIYIINTRRPYTLFADGTSKPAIAVTVNGRRTLADDSLSKATKLAMPDGKYDGFTLKRMRVTRDPTSSSPSSQQPAETPQTVPPADAQPSNTDDDTATTPPKKKHLFIIFLIFVLIMIVILVALALRARRSKADQVEEIKEPKS